MHIPFKIGSYLVFINVLIIIFTSCSYKQSQVLFENRNSIPDSILTKAGTQNDTSEYRISPQDVLQIRNLQNPKYIVEDAPQNNGVTAGGANTGQSFQVEKDGNVVLPVLGKVHVAGLTRSQASKLIEDLYRKNLLVDPIIELKVTNLKVIMLGEIKAQGNIQLTKDRTTLIELIGQAGGLTERADERHVKIIRNDHHNISITVIDLRDVNILNDPRIIMHNNDIVYFTENRRAIRSDQNTNLSSIIQPAVLLISTVVIILSLTRR